MSQSDPKADDVSVLGEKAEIVQSGSVPLYAIR